MLSRFLLSMLFDSAAVALCVIGACIGLYWMPGFISGLLCLLAFFLMAVTAHAIANNIAE